MLSNPRFSGPTRPVSFSPKRIAADRPEAQKLLDLPEHFAIAALLPIGKPTKL